jgi:hypothetical protein
MTHVITRNIRCREAKVNNSSDDILKLIHDSRALSIWDRKKGPVFWYTMGVPGPFFINTEWVIGKALAESLVDGISTIMERVHDAVHRAEQIMSLIMTAYDRDPIYRDVVGSIVAKANREFPVGSYNLVSGGERRDWIFSVPFARETAMRHVFLFKDLTYYCAQHFEPEENVLHVTDLINNAASYFDRWFPALEKAHLRCHKTVCVVSRNHGVAKLEEANIEVVPLARVDLAFFEKSYASGIIDKMTLDEIALHFRSPETWAERYLFNNPGVFDVANADSKSFERLQTFVAKDPWALRGSHPEFFDKMQAAIAVRKKSAA